MISGQRTGRILMLIHQLILSARKLITLPIELNKPVWSNNSKPLFRHYRRVRLVRRCQMFESQAIPLSDVVPVSQARMKKGGNFGKGAIDLVQDRPPLLWRHG